MNPDPSGPLTAIMLVILFGSIAGVTIRRRKTPGGLHTWNQHVQHVQKQKRGRGHGQKRS